MKTNEDKFNDFMDWLDSMNSKFQNIEANHRKSQINTLLTQNGIEPIE